MSDGSELAIAFNRIRWDRLNEGQRREATAPATRASVAARKRRAAERRAAREQAQHDDTGPQDAA